MSHSLPLSLSLLLFRSEALARGRAADSKTVIKSVERKQGNVDEIRTFLVTAPVLCCAVLHVGTGDPWQINQSNTPSSCMIADAAVYCACCRGSSRLLSLQHAHYTAAREHALYVFPGQRVQTHRGFCAQICRTQAPYTHREGALHHPCLQPQSVAALQVVLRPHLRLTVCRRVPCLRRARAGPLLCLENTFSPLPAACTQTRLCVAICFSGSEISCSKNATLCRAGQLVP